MTREAKESGLPPRPEAITPYWLSETLAATGVLQSGQVAQFLCEPIGEGFGLTGVIARLTLQFTTEPAAMAPRTVIAKFPNAGRGPASAFREANTKDLESQRRYFDWCSREVRFYREIAPKCAMSAPTCYAALVDESNERIVLLLQDLAGHRAGDVLRGCVVSDVEEVLRAIARLHARFWGVAMRPDLDWLQKWDRTLDARQQRYCASLGNLMARSDMTLPAGIRELLDLLTTQYAPLMRSLAATPQTVIHGDLHLDNVLFRPSSEGAEAVLIDWQSVSLGPAAVDVAMFMVGSLSAPDRRAGEADLLRGYLATIRSLGVVGYGLDDLWRDSTLALMWLLTGVVNWIGSADLDVLSGRERKLVDAALGDGRIISALTDRKALALLDSL